MSTNNAPVPWWSDFQLQPLEGLMVVVWWPSDGVYQIGRATLSRVEWLDFTGGECDFDMLSADGARWRYFTNLAAQ